EAGGEQHRGGRRQRAGDAAHSGDADAENQRAAVADAVGSEAGEDADGGADQHEGGGQQATQNQAHAELGAELAEQRRQLADLYRDQHARRNDGGNSDPVRAVRRGRGGGGGHGLFVWRQQKRKTAGQARRSHSSSFSAADHGIMRSDFGGRKLPSNSSSALGARGRPTAWATASEERCRRAMSTPPKPFSLTHLVSTLRSSDSFRRRISSASSISPSRVLVALMPISGLAAISRQALTVALTTAFTALGFSLMNF